jgi:pimeloyl-ACP methyl ester carboxylesterase
VETFAQRGDAIRFERRGQGPPVVLLHNGGTSHAIWDELAAALATDHETFALDLLGYGASAKPGSGYTLERYIEILGDFIDGQRLVRPSLVGNCMGSAMALGLAARRPREVGALVLVNPLTAATFTAGWLGWLLRLRRLAPGPSRALYGPLGRLRLGRFLATQSLRFQLGARGRARGVERSEELCACQTSPGQLRSLLGALDDLEHYDVLDRLAPGPDFPPICTIWGMENKVLSARAGRRLNETLQPRRAEWLAGCGHLAMLERPEEVAAIVREFLVEHARSSATARPEQAAHT